MHGRPPHDFQNALAFDDDTGRRAVPLQLVGKVAVPNVIDIPTPIPIEEVIDRKRNGC
jgi:hypothetical protein